MREGTLDGIATEKRNENETNVQDPEKENETNETNHVINATKSAKNGNQNMEKSKLKKNPLMMVRLIIYLYFFCKLYQSILTEIMFVALLILLNYLKRHVFFFNI